MVDLDPGAPQKYDIFYRFFTVDNLARSYYRIVCPVAGSVLIEPKIERSKAKTVFTFADFHLVVMLKLTLHVIIQGDEIQDQLGDDERGER
jgi:hypothetical protein